MLEKMYNKVDFAEHEPYDEPKDINGYYGKSQYYRTSKKQEGIKEKDFIKKFIQTNKMVEVMRTILEIDKDRNGYITSSEMDDILKLYYPSLEEHNILPIIKKFSSIQNKILIDYKGLTTWINTNIQRQGSLEFRAGSSSVTPSKGELKYKNFKKLDSQASESRKVVRSQIDEAYNSRSGAITD
jgi:hypothetical protein